MGFFGRAFWPAGMVVRAKCWREKLSFFAFHYSLACFVGYAVMLLTSICVLPKGYIPLYGISVNAAHSQEVARVLEAKGIRYEVTRTNVKVPPSKTYRALTALVDARLWPVSGFDFTVPDNAPASMSRGNIESLHKRINEVQCVDFVTGFGDVESARVNLKRGESASVIVGTVSGNKLDDMQALTIARIVSSRCGIDPMQVILVDTRGRYYRIPDINSLETGVDIELSLPANDMGEGN